LPQRAPADVNFGASPEAFRPNATVSRPAGARAGRLQGDAARDGSATPIADRAPGGAWKGAALFGLAFVAGVAATLALAFRHEIRELVGPIAGALFHGSSPPWPAPRRLTDTDVADVVAFAPSRAVRGETFLVQVFVGKTGEDEAPARTVATASDPSATKRAVAALDVELAPGDRIDFSLEAAGLIVSEPEQGLIWRGSARSAAFLVTVPEDLPANRAAITARVYRQSVPIGRIAFSIPIVAEARPEPLSPVGDASRVYRRAFLSYASGDRLEVVKRAQALKAAKIEFFIDLLSLEPGDRWERRLYTEIDRCDLFILFWSSAARDSPWVANEIDYAVSCIGKADSIAAARPEIHPIILEGPPPPQPPEALAFIPFNDPLLYVTAALDRLNAARPAN
jgi:hypothetical protein